MRTITRILAYLTGCVLFEAAGCTSAERAPIERKLTAALTDANLICLMGTHIPGAAADVHAGIVEGCQIGPGAAQVALDLLQAADLMHVGDKTSDAGGGQ